MLSLGWQGLAIQASMQEILAVAGSAGNGRVRGIDHCYQRHRSSALNLHAVLMCMEAAG